MRRDVGALAVDVEREVADDPDAAVGRVRAERAPLALEAHLPRHLAFLPGERGPVVEPVLVTPPERGDLAGGHPCSRLGEQPAPAREGGATGVRRAERVGRAERQHLPVGLTRVHEPVDERVRLRPEPAPGK